MGGETYFVPAQGFANILEERKHQVSSGTAEKDHGPRASELQSLSCCVTQGDGDWGGHTTLLGTLWGLAHPNPRLLAAHAAGPDSHQPHHAPWRHSPAAGIPAGTAPPFAPRLWAARALGRRGCQMGVTAPGWVTQPHRKEFHHRLVTFLLYLRNQRVQQRFPL